MHTEPPRHEPLQVGRDTWLIRELESDGTGAFSVYTNSLVIRGSQPIVVDTGTAENRSRWLEDVWSVVDPEDVRWVFLSHEDRDHCGNLLDVLEACPRAILLTNWLTATRMRRQLDIPSHRMRWLNNGDHVDLGDRTIAVVRPPFYDAPTTQGLFDGRTGTYWAGDCFGTPVKDAVDSAADLAADDFRDGQITWHRLLSPWAHLVDVERLASHISQVEDLAVETIATAHGPVITGGLVEKALGLLRLVPLLDPIRWPGQPALDAIIAREVDPFIASPAE